MDERFERHAVASDVLRGLDERGLADLVARVRPLGTGIGGATGVVDVAGAPVFVKRVALTDLERAHPRSTANLFGLPVRCQYGVGSPGFGAWRELAAHELTTAWALAGRATASPLLHHARVLPGAPPQSGELDDVDAAVAYWGGDPAVRLRLDALARASASLVLFSEYVPYTLSDWLTTHGPTAAVALDHPLWTSIAAMTGAGLLHFDTHLRNILTDGTDVYLADLGLATSVHFELSTVESAFVAAHAGHDLAYALAQLVNRLVTQVTGVRVGPDEPPTERDRHVQACADGRLPAGIDPAVADILARYSPVATVVNAFYRDLFGVSRSTPYPAERIRLALTATTPPPTFRGRAGRVRP